MCEENVHVINLLTTKEDVADALLMSFLVLYGTSAAKILEGVGADSCTLRFPGNITNPSKPTELVVQMSSWVRCYLDFSLSSNGNYMYEVRRCAVREWQGQGK